MERMPEVSENARKQKKERFKVHSHQPAEISF